MRPTREKLADRLRRLADRLDPPYDRPEQGHIVILGGKGRRAVFEIGGPVSVHVSAQNTLAPLGQHAWAAARQMGIVVHLGERVDSAPAWLQERLA